MKITFQGEYDIEEALNGEELKCRESFVNGSNVPDYIPADWDIKQGIPFKRDGERQYFIPSMEEDDFFDMPIDISVVPHTRYSPAFIHTHGFIEMIYVLKGSCTNEILDKRLLMHAGDICIVAPGTKHVLQVFNDECIVYNYLIRSSTFEETFFSILSSNSVLADFFKHIFYSEKGNSYLLFRTGDDMEIGYYLAKIYDESKNAKSYKNEMMNAILTMYFLILVRKHASDVVLPSDEEDGNENPVKILRYMQENYETATLPEMSVYFHYSERHMKRIIKKYTGRSFSENILRIRMSKARHLLAKTKLSVEEVAMQSGYSDVSSFRYAFKKYYNALPKDFREPEI